MSRRPHLALLLLVALPALAAPPPPGVQPWAWEQAGDDGDIEVLVLLEARADLGAARRPAGDRLARRRAVVEALRATAAASQGDLLRLLDARGLAYRSFRIRNAVLVTADRRLMEELAARPDVARVVGNPRVRGAVPALSEAAPKAVVPWGVLRIGAPELWALGIDGTGVVVGGQDTGVRWTHVTLRTQYRGWDGAGGTHDFNWHDAIHDAPGNPCGADSAVPCDDQGHGTHTLATAVGGTIVEAVGVAPGAKWIACRNMDEDIGTPASYLECFEWLLAPWALGADPTTGDPALGADVTVNSWTCPPSEGCDWDVLRPAVEAHRAAGVFSVYAAGNEGPACGSLADPPALYDASTTVGATNDTDGVWRSSSRGPAAHTGLLKPDLVAPGVSVRSATNESNVAFSTWSGTSMATPHVAGAVALLWSALPGLRGDVDATEALLEQTALRLPAIAQGCGGDDAFGPNDTWGHGRLDVWQAFSFYEAPTEETDCTDGIDEDGDGARDCADRDCAGDPACPEIGHCDDRVDNDLDGDRDCADSECLGDPACPESANCADGLDNDLDGSADCDDRDCDRFAACPVLAASAVLRTTPAGPEPPLQDAFAAACRDPKWRPCPAALFPGALPLRIIGEAATTGSRHVRIYDHSAGGADVRFVRDGEDLLVTTP